MSAELDAEPSGSFIDVDTYRKLDAECERLKAEIRQLHVTVCGLIINEKSPIEFSKTATHYFQVFPCQPQSSQRTAPAPSAADQTQSAWPPMDVLRAKDILSPPDGTSNSEPPSLSLYLETLTGRIVE